MPNNINKVIVNGETKLDLTSDTVTASSLLAGVTAHDKSGALVIGFLQDHDVNDVTISGTVITIPPGLYSKGITINLKDWEWDPLDFETGIITNATQYEISEEE